jgi:hypothetical protein
MYSSYICSNLEYSLIWSPLLKGQKEVLENI